MNGLKMNELKMNEKKIVGNLKISFQNSSRNKQVIQNKEHFRKVKDYLEKNIIHTDGDQLVSRNKKLINDQDNLQNIFDEVRQIVENESDLEFIELKSDCDDNESCSSVESTVASYNIHEIYRDDSSQHIHDNLSKQSGFHDNITKNIKISKITENELKIEQLTHQYDNKDKIGKENKNKLRKDNYKSNFVQTYIERLYSPAPNYNNAETNFPTSKIFPKYEEKFPIKQSGKSDEDKLVKLTRKELYIRNNLTPEKLKTTSAPVPLIKESLESSKDDRKMAKLREEYFNYKLSQKLNKTNSEKTNITSVYATAICASDLNKPSNLNDEKFTRENDFVVGYKTQGLLPCKQNQSHNKFESNHIREIKNGKDEYKNHEYTIDEIKKRIKNNTTSRVQKNILKLNLLNTAFDSKRKTNEKKYEKNSSNKDLVSKKTMIDNYFNYGQSVKEDYTNVYKKTDYHPNTAYFDDGYGSESNRTYSSSVSQSMDVNGFTDLMNSNTYHQQRSNDLRNSYYIDSYNNDDIISTNHDVRGMHKKYSKSQSDLDNLMTHNNKESKYHDVELEKENRKTIHSKLENLLKEKVKSMSDLTKAATLPPKKYKQNQMAVRPVDKTKTLPSNYMQEHVYNQLYGNFGPPNLKLDSESENEEYDPTPIRSSKAQTRPNSMYQTNNGNSKDAVLRESMLSELKKTVKGRNMKQKEKAEKIFSPSRTKNMKQRESESRIERRQQKSVHDSYDTSVAMDVLHDFDLINASFDKDERLTTENYQQSSQRYVAEKQRNRKQNASRESHRDKNHIIDTVNNNRGDANLPSAKFLREKKSRRGSHTDNYHSKPSSPKPGSSKPGGETSKDSNDEDIYLFDSFPLPKDFTLPSRSKPTSPSSRPKSPRNRTMSNSDGNETFISDNQRNGYSKSVPMATSNQQLHRRNSMKLNTRNQQSSDQRGKNEISPIDLSPTDLEIKSILEQHSSRSSNSSHNASMEQRPTKTKNSRSQRPDSQTENIAHNTSQHKTPAESMTHNTSQHKVAAENMVHRSSQNKASAENMGHSTSQQKAQEQRLSLIEKRISNLGGSTMTLSNVKMSEKIIQATGFKNDEEKRRSKSAAEMRSENTDQLTSFILRESPPVSNPKREVIHKKPSVYDELTDKLIKARALERQEKSLDDLRREMGQKKGQSTSLINLDEINKTPTREAPVDTESDSQTKSNVHERFSRQTYTATNIGKVNIPKQFQNTDYRFSSPKSVSGQAISRSTPASPTKKTRSFSFNSRKSPIPRPKSTQSANTSRPSTPKFITNKIRSLFSPRSKRKMKNDVSSDVLLTDSNEFIARRTNMNRSIGNEGYDFDDLTDGMNGDLSDDGDDIDVDFITNQDWLNQEQQIKNSDNGSTRSSNSDDHEDIKHNMKFKQNKNKQKKMKPYIKGSLIPSSKNGSIQLKSKHGIGKVVVPDVFSDVGNKQLQHKNTDNLSKRSSTLSDFNNNHPVQNGKIPHGDKSYVDSAAHVKGNGHISNGYDEGNVKMSRNRRMQDVPVNYNTP